MVQMQSRELQQEKGKINLTPSPAPLSQDGLVMPNRVFYFNPCGRCWYLHIYTHEKFRCRHCEALVGMPKSDDGNHMKGILPLLGEQFDSNAFASASVHIKIELTRLEFDTDDCQKTSVLILFIRNGLNNI